MKHMIKVAEDISRHKHLSQFYSDTSSCCSIIDIGLDSYWHGGTV